MNMISYITHAVNLMATILQNAIVLSSYIGHIIVLVITTILSALLKVVDSILLFYRIVYEDNITIFTEELTSVTNSLSETILLQWTCLIHVLYDCYNQIFTLYSNITNSFWNIIDCIYIILSECIRNTKTVFIFVGEAIWLVITFFPIHLPYILKTVLTIIKESIVNHTISFYMYLLNITNFLSDVPLQSFLGIISAIIVTRLFITYKDRVVFHINNFYWTCKREIMILYYYVYEWCFDDEGRVMAQIAGNPTISREMIDDGENIGSGSNLLCVICQERQKCIVILPCRHVCLCSVCFLNLFAYQRTCPICRTFIIRSMPIYL